MRGARPKRRLQNVLESFNRVRLDLRLSISVISIPACSWRTRRPRIRTNCKWRGEGGSVTGDVISLSLSRPQNRPKMTSYASPIGGSPVMTAGPISIEPQKNDDTLGLLQKPETRAFKLVGHAQPQEQTRSTSVRNSIVTLSWHCKLVHVRLSIRAWISCVRPYCNRNPQGN